MFTQNKDMLKEILQESVQEILEAQMSELLNAESYERTEGRRGYRAGYYRRHLNTRVGMIELRVPQDRDGQFSMEVFERYQRSEKALVCSMMEMYVQGGSRARRSSAASDSARRPSASWRSRRTGGRRSSPGGGWRRSIRILFWMRDMRRSGSTGRSSRRPSS